MPATSPHRPRSRRRSIPSSSRAPPSSAPNQAVVAAEAQLRSARREVVPDLTLRAGEQWNNELIRQNPNVATGAQSFASASIDLPLWNRNQGNIAAAQAAVNAAQAEAQRVRLALRQSAAPLVEQYNIAAAQSSRYKSDLLPRAQRAYELYRDRYRQMAAAYPQVLVSQRTLFQLQLAYIQSLGELWQSSARLRHFTLNGALASRKISELRYVAKLILGSDFRPTHSPAWSAPCTTAPGGPPGFPSMLSACREHIPWSPSRSVRILIPGHAARDISMTSSHSRSGTE